MRAMRSWKWILWTLAIGALAFAVLRWVGGGEYASIVAMQALTAASILLVGGAVIDEIGKQK